MQLFPNAVRPNARAISAFALVLGITLGGLVLAPTVASAADPTQDSISMSAAPLNEGGTTIRTRFDYQIGPGQVLDDSYVVTNQGSTPQAFTIFATDAFNTEDGSFALLDTGVQPSDAGSWVMFGGQTSVTVDLQPAESATVPFTVQVPADASPGDHAGGVVVSLQSPEGQVLVDRRLGTRLYVRVPGDLQPNLSIAGMTSSYTPSLNPLTGETTVTFTVRNAGNVALSGQLKTEVKGLFGIGLAPADEQEVSEMLPGGTRTVTAVVTGVGQWVFLNPVVTLYPAVEETAPNPGPLTSISRDTILFVVPWVLLAVIAIGLAIWAWIWFSRRRNDRRAQEWIAYTEAEARRKVDDDREPTPAGVGSPGVTKS